MRDAPVHNMGAVHAAPHCFHTALDLGDHAAGNDALVLQPRHIADVDDRNERSLILLIPQEAAMRAAAVSALIL